MMIHERHLTGVWLHRESGKVTVKSKEVLKLRDFNNILAHSTEYLTMRISKKPVPFYEWIIL